VKHPIQQLFTQDAQAACEFLYHLDATPVTTDCFRAAIYFDNDQTGDAAQNALALKALLEKTSFAF
jgi:hypothetical protein